MRTEGDAKRARQEEQIGSREVTVRVRDEKPLLLTAKDIAALCGVSVRTVWEWRAAGRLPAPIRLGRLIRWRRKDIEDWIEAGCPDMSKADRLDRLHRALDGGQN